MHFCPSYHLAGASPLPLDVGYLYLVGSNILLWMVVQQLAAILEFSQEEMSAGSSTLPSCYLRIPSSPNSFLALTNSSLDRTAILGVLHVTLLHIKGNLCSFVHSFIHSFIRSHIH